MKVSKKFAKFISMEEFEIRVEKENGLHARPAGKLVNVAGGFDSNITVTKGNQSASAKGLFALMGLGIKQGDKVTVECEGIDEKNASIAMKEFFKNNFSSCKNSSESNNEVINDASKNGNEINSDVPEKITERTSQNIEENADDN